MLYKYYNVYSIFRIKSISINACLIEVYIKIGSGTNVFANWYTSEYFLLHISFISVPKCDWLLIPSCWIWKLTLGSLRIIAASPKEGSEALLNVQHNREQFDLNHRYINCCPVVVHIRILDVIHFSWILTIRPGVQVSK